MRPAALIPAAALLGVLVAGPVLADPPQTRKTYTLFASGDTNLARWVHFKIYQQGPLFGLGEIKDLIADADVALTNVECVVATGGKMFDKGEGRPYLYRARPEMLDVLTEVGMDVAVTGNNHAMDYGPEALLEMNQLLRAAGMVSVGSGKNRQDAGTPVYVQVGDLVLAFIGMETEFPILRAKKDRPGVFHAKGTKGVLKALKGPVAEARKHADLVIFTPHWGANWTENTTKKRIKLAHQIIDLGVDAILGHSSHHLHGIEAYKGRPIVYDMGCLFFDTIKQKRMRLGAGFLFEFDQGGFRTLHLHPLDLQSNHTVPAQGRRLEQIQTILVERTAEIDEDLKLVPEGDGFVVSFDRPDPPPPRSADPPAVHVTGSTRRLPDDLRNKQSDVVLDRPPAWTAGVAPIELEQGITVLGAQNSEAVYPGRAFMSAVALKVAGPLPYRWESRLVGIERGGKKRFEWHHPVADGAWIPERWQAGQIGLDRTLARPRAKVGTYDLYWGLQQVYQRKWAKPKKPIPGAPEGLVPIGTLYVTKDVPNKPAGLAWDGKLSHRLRQKLGIAEPAPTSCAAGQASAGLAWGAPLAAALLFGLLLLVSRRGLH